VDPITAAIIAAISSGMAEVGKEGVLDAYKALKSLLSRKFGSHSQVIKAVEDLEHNPSSQARTAVLQEEVAKAKADQDPDLRRAAYSLYQQVNQSSVSRSNQVAYGNRNVQQQAGQNAYHVSGRGNVTKAGRDVIYGRTGLVVLMAIVLVAIFAFLIWQLVPSARQLVGANPTPTPTPITVTPGGTLTYFCALVRANGSDYAYQDLYSDNLKKQVTAEQFNKEWSFFNNPLSSCISTIKSSSGTAATGTITTESARNQLNQVYSVNLIKIDGQWKIDSLQKQ
jgi:hypothetical protein